MSVDDITDDLERFIEDSVKDLSITFTETVSQSTPVLTGFAQTNWVPRIGRPFEGTAGTKQNAELGILNPRPKASGIANIRSRYSLRQGDVYITNNVDYITDLNMGSSRKAPADFVQRDILTTIRRANSNANNRRS